MKKRTVFLDKDGTLVDDIPYNVDPDLVRLAPEVLKGLELLTAAGYRLIVITNQSGVARGMFAESDLSVVEERLCELLGARNVSLSGFYYCPHHPEGVVSAYAVACNCRKPEPGLLLRAAHEHSIDLASAWLIGDILNDIEAGRKAGVRTVLLDNGNETDWQLNADRYPHFLAADFLEAAHIILREDYLPQVLQRQFKGSELAA
jgi:D,D-heptose 1,7-bisphosphate phosphatase